VEALSGLDFHSFGHMYYHGSLFFIVCIMLNHVSYVVPVWDEGDVWGPFWSLQYKEAKLTFFFKKKLYHTVLN
jgi:hypothetical protein